MITNTTLGMAFVALVIGFGSGYTLRPYIAGSPATVQSAPPEAELDHPTEAEAIEAVRRRQADTFPNITLKLGECSKSPMTPGVMCMTAVTFDGTKPGALAQNRPIAFARVNNQWEVALW